MIEIFIKIKTDLCTGNVIEHKIQCSFNESRKLTIKIEECTSFELTNTGEEIMRLIMMDVFWTLYM